MLDTFVRVDWLFVFVFWYFVAFEGCEGFGGCVSSWPESSFLRVEGGRGSFASSFVFALKCWIGAHGGISLYCVILLRRFVSPLIFFFDFLRFSCDFACFFWLCFLFVSRI